MDLSPEDVILPLPVLRHVSVDSMTLLEECRDLLNGSECRSPRETYRSERGGRVSRLIIARLSHALNDAVTVIIDEKDLIKRTLL